MSWAQLHLVAPREHVAIVEEALLNAGALSVTLGDEHDSPILEPGIGETPLWPEVRISALFETSCNRDDVLSQLCLACPVVGVAGRWEAVADRLWEREWLQHFKPLRFGQRLWVCPTTSSVDAEDAVVITLDPGLAFGTGTHPSTALCLEWLDAHPPAGQHVIDYGCGSGILSLASLLLGASRVEAIDIDPQALTATLDNATRNAVEPSRLRVLDAAACDTTAADLLLANILAGILIDLAPRFARMLRPGGRALLAGILEPQTDAVRAAFAPYFDAVAQDAREGWCRLELCRNSRAEH